MTPLMVASCYNQLDIVKYLILNGANILQKDNYSMTAIDYARKLGQKNMEIFLKQNL